VPLVTGLNRSNTEADDDDDDGDGHHHYLYIGYPERRYFGSSIILHGLGTSEEPQSQYPTEIRSPASEFRSTVLPLHSLAPKERNEEEYGTVEGK
jgi:hypothetical protein